MLQVGEENYDVGAMEYDVQRSGLLLITVLTSFVVGLNTEDSEYDTEDHGAVVGIRERRETEAST